MNTAEFLLWEMRSRDTIDVKRCYIDISGDLVSGVLLSQVIYWHLPDEQGNSKLRVHHDGHDWLAKKREDWWGECRITPKQFDRAVEILENKNLVITHIYRFNGSPTKHIRMNWDGFFKSLESLQDGDFTQRSKSNSPSKSILPKGEFPTSPNGKLENEQRVKTITKSTAETTTEITPPLTPQRGEEGVHESKADDFRQEQEEEGETVVVEAEIVTEEEIKNEINPSVENGKLAIRSINSNPGGDLDCAPACDNNPALQRILDAVESGKVAKLPPHDLKKLADYRIKNLLSLYRKSGNIHSSSPNDISRDFLAYVAQNDLSIKIRTINKAAERICKLEQNPKQWPVLNTLVEGWLKQEYKNLAEPPQAPKEKYQKREELRKLMNESRI